MSLDEFMMKPKRFKRCAPRSASDVARSRSLIARKLAGSRIGLVMPADSIRIRCWNSRFILDRQAREKWALHVNDGLTFEQFISSKKWSNDLHRDLREVSPFCDGDDPVSGWVYLDMLYIYKFERDGLEFWSYTESNQQIIARVNANPLRHPTEESLESLEMRLYEYARREEYTAD